MPPQRRQSHEVKEPVMTEETQEPKTQDGDAVETAEESSEESQSE
ncbi:hypothetical protein GCM10010218_13030 [Streptomyces mashuensis]|uniref:Uncharacterized protein n=1 Tax=Streptomyces mashuensis TaxID=33904 RepID=A0A919B0T5_9ACTN|nr:hypothetical protein GCM10010218_13030 [Streptomyces mashuensis]